ncbi:MAG: hypothetical protein CM15mP7_0210 [Pelagibacteraceae bacterium]|nr:MAG: hypothetical protein CM15mP7_0210 [Pelagibacteraceae bacterium]
MLSIIKFYFFYFLFFLGLINSSIAEDYSLSFNGTNEYVSVPFDSTMNPSGNFSVSAWVKLSNKNAYRSAVTSRSETVNGNQTGGYMLYISNANKWQFWNGFGNTGGLWKQANSSTRIIENTWQMQTVTYDHANTHMRLYVDGILVAQNNSASLVANTDKPLYIGAGRTNKHPHDVDPPQFHFNGKIDDVAIWNAMLSSDEIVQLYNSGETLYAGDNYGNYTSSGSLQEYWTMDTEVSGENNGTGTTLFGEKNNNDGTFVNTPDWDDADFPGTVPSLSSSSPADDETNVLTDINIVLNFSEIIKVNTGNITLKKTSDDSVVEIFDINGANVSLSSNTQITIDPTDFLEKNTDYYVLIDATAIVDLSRNNYGGISNKTTYNFSTGGKGATNPLDDKDVVASIEAQTEAPKKVLQHITTPIFNRLNWIRGYETDNNLNSQKIKFNIVNPKIDKILNIIPETVSLNKIPTRLEDDWLFWSEGSISVGRVGETSTSSFKEIDTNAITIGWDKKIDQKKIHGYAITYTKDDVKVGDNGSTLDVESYSFSTYATFHRKENSYVEGILGTSKLDLRNKRVKNNNSLKGDRNGKQFFGSIHYINTISNEKVNISPNLRLDLSYTKLTDYTETGSNAISYDEQTVETAGIFGGFTFNKEVFKDDYIIRPSAGFELGLDLSPNSDISLNYVSDPNTKYTKSIDQQGEESIKGKVGFDLLKDNGWSLMAFYERNQSQNRHSDTFYFLTGYVVSKDEEYVMKIDENKTSLVYKKNIDGVDIKFDSGYELFTENPDYYFNLKLTRNF